jgi:hypothetical protein
MERIQYEKLKKSSYAFRRQNHAVLRRRRKFRDPAAQKYVDEQDVCKLLLMKFLSKFVVISLQLQLHRLTDSI